MVRQDSIVHGTPGTEADRGGSRWTGSLPTQSPPFPLQSRAIWPEPPSAAAECVGVCRLLVLDSVTFTPQCLRQDPYGLSALPLLRCHQPRDLVWLPSTRPSRFRSIFCCIVPCGGADKGLQGPCIAFLSFVPQSRGRQLLAASVRPPLPTSHMCLAPTPCLPPPRPPPPSICCRVRGCSTEVRTSVRRDLVFKERDLVYQEAKETYLYMFHLGHVPRPCPCPCLHISVE